MTTDLHCYACIDVSFQCDDINHGVYEKENLNQSALKREGDNSDSSAVAAAAVLSF